MPTVEPWKGGIQLKLKQSPTEILPRLSTRCLIAGPSMCGKGVLMSSLLLDPAHFRGCFDHIIYCSQSAAVDDNLIPLKKYCEETLEQKEPCLYSEFPTEVLEEHLEEQLKLVAYMKRQAKKEKKKIIRGYQSCIVVDDFADDVSVMRGKAGQILQTLAVRGRHANISLFLLVQKIRTVHPMIRNNLNHLFIFRLRSRVDLDAILDEYSALVRAKKELEAIYKKAVASPHSFLYINLMADPPKFFKSFEAELVPNTH